MLCDPKREILQPHAEEGKGQINQRLPASFLILQQAALCSKSACQYFLFFQTSLILQQPQGNSYLHFHCEQKISPACCPWIVYIYISYQEPTPILSPDNMASAKKKPQPPHTHANKTRNLPYNKEGDNANKLRGEIQFSVAQISLEWKVRGSDSNKHFRPVLRLLSQVKRALSGDLWTYLKFSKC